jgi:hypothetical protein
MSYDNLSFHFFNCRKRSEKFVVDSHTNTYFKNARYLKKQKRFGQFPRPLFRIHIVCFGNWKNLIIRSSVFKSSLVKELEINIKINRKKSVVLFLNLNLGRRIDTPS